LRGTVLRYSRTLVIQCQHMKIDIMANIGSIFSGISYQTNLNLIRCWGSEEFYFRRYWSDFPPTSRETQIVKFLKTGCRTHEWRVSLNLPLSYEAFCINVCLTKRKHKPLTSHASYLAVSTTDLRLK
jgi:hypothetical protein